MPNIAGGGATGGAPAGDGAGGCCAATSQTAISIIEAVKLDFLRKFIVVLVSFPVRFKKGYS
jgi:hypothetical protein